MYRNPYPDYVDCDEALESLVDEIRNADFETMSPKLGERIRKSIWDSRSSGPRPDTPEDTARMIRAAKMIDDIRSPGDVKNFYTQLYSREFFGYSSIIRFVINSMTDIHPAYLMLDAEVVSDVHFAHTFPRSRRQEIEMEGIYGRATPSRLSLTRNVTDFYIQNNGFIFAYEADTFYKGETVVMFSSLIEGRASKALKFYFEPDEEMQLIVPVKCIAEYTFEDLPDTYEPEWGWDDEDAEGMLPQPSRLAYGTEMPCVNCKSLTAVRGDTVTERGVVCRRCATL